MNDSKIAVRYARALFLIACEKDLLEQVHADMILISGALKESPGFKDVLFSPVTRPSVRNKLISEVFGDNIQRITLNFLLLLVQNNRFQYIEPTAYVFFTVYRKHKGIKTASLTTPFEMTEEIKNKFLAVLKAVYKADIEITTSKNSDLVGGFVLTVDDQQYDASIATQLKKLRSSLHKTN